VDPFEGVPSNRNGPLRPPPSLFDKRDVIGSEYGANWERNTIVKNMAKREKFSQSIAIIFNR
jgi:hypothetical protein